MHNSFCRKLLSRREVASALGHSESWFRAQYKNLQAKNFPDPVVNCGLNWDPKAIEIWLDLQINSKFKLNDNFNRHANTWENELIAKARAL